MDRTNTLYAANTPKYAGTHHNAVRTPHIRALDRPPWPLNKRRTIPDAHTVSTREAERTGLLARPCRLMTAIDGCAKAAQQIDAWRTILQPAAGTRKTL